MKEMKNPAPQRRIKGRKALPARYQLEFVERTIRPQVVLSPNDAGAQSL